MNAGKRIVSSAESMLPVQVNRKLQPRHHAFLLPLVLLLIGAPLPTRDELTSTVGELHAFVVVDGIERPIHVGDVLAQGQLVGSDREQFCEMPETTYGLAGSSSGQASVTLHITSNCQLVVVPNEVLTGGAEDSAPVSDSMKSYPADQPGVRTYETRETRVPDGD